MHTVKDKVLLYVPVTTTQLTRLKLDLAVSTDLKVKRGWNDPQCSSLLIPPRLQDEFCADPLWVFWLTRTLQTCLWVWFRAFMSKAQSSQIKIRATEFPSFLYVDASKFDKNKPYNGLLRGPILIHITFWSLSQFLLPLKWFLGFPMYFHWPKHSDAEECLKSFKITGRDP